MIKVKHVIIAKTFAFFASIFAIIALAGAFLLKLILENYWITITGFYFLILLIILLSYLASSELVVEDDVLVYNVGPFKCDKMPIDTIRMVVTYKSCERQHIDIISRKNKCIEINTTYSNADKLLDYIGRYSTERDLDVSWIEQ